MTDPSRAAAFLNPTVDQLRSPMGLAGMPTAVRRIGTALTANEKILVFGDYDTDGITATAILLTFFRQAGADPLWYIPDRITEGYGLSRRHIDEVAIPQGVGLIVTADCGSASHGAIAHAREKGIDVIVTDHHHIDLPLPAAAAVINPKRPDCPSGYTHLAGAGVAFFLVLALRRHLRQAGFWPAGNQPNLKSYCDLVAVGTIADIVPLVDENRILTKTGLEVLMNAPKPWLQAFRQDGTIAGTIINSRDVAFRLAPRLNAAGRLDHARHSVNFLLAPDMAASLPMADILNRLNTQRQSIEKAICYDIKALMDSQPFLAHQPALVLASSTWHEGVLGIAAGRLAKQLGKPVVLISTRSGLGKGSGRSVAGIDLFRALAQSAEWLQGFGGHDMAAGLTIEPQMVAPFAEAFRRAVVALRTAAPAGPERLIDSYLELSDISEALVSELELLEPFGAGNPEPLFLAHNVRVDNWRWMGQKHWHLRLSCRSGGQPIEAVRFNPACPRPPARWDHVVFRLGRNHWNGRQNLRIQIEACDPDGQVG
jgi:single-stranded-DNA-specific exonuclease